MSFNFNLFLRITNYTLVITAFFIPDNQLLQFEMSLHQKVLFGFWAAFVDQFCFPLDIQLTDATASRGLAPKPPESGWYPQCLPYWIDGVSFRKDTQSYEYFSLCYDDPAPGQGWPRGRRMRSLLPSVRCLASNLRLALCYRFGLHNKYTVSLGCVVLVHPTLLMFIEYCSNTYMDIQVPHTGYTHGWCLTSGGSS